MTSLTEDIRIEIFELIARCIFKSMLHPSEYFDNKTPVFDHCCTTAFEWTAQLLHKAGLLEPVDEVQPGQFPHCFVLTCEPQDFRLVIEKNIDALPDEENCLLLLWGFGGQSGDFYNEPIISFLQKHGFVETVHLPIGPMLKRLKTAFERDMPGVQIPEEILVELAHDRLVEHNLTEKGQRISDIEHAIARGPSVAPT